MIKKIVLKIGKKEFSLSPKEAKELKDVLNELYGGNTYPIYLAELKSAERKLAELKIDRYPSEPWPYKHWWPPTITWGDTTTTTNVAQTDGIAYLSNTAAIAGNSQAQALDASA